MKVTEILTTKNFPSSSSRLDLELLLSAALSRPREFLYTNPEYQLTEDEAKTFCQLYQRRLHGEPIAYILGKKEFWGLELVIDNKVLIPRPETEILVETVLRELVVKEANIADLGTGSGAVALALAHERPLWHVIAVDVSEGALQIAKNNARRLNIQNIDFCYSNWCDNLPSLKFDAIVSNPPYVSKNDPHLLQGDVRFEPKIALESEDGFCAIKIIATQAKSKLKSGGMLALEHGYDQSEQVRKILPHNGYRQIESHRDLAGIYRVMTAIT